MTQAVEVEVLVFDLGGVLVDWNGVDPLIELTAGRLSREAARQFWMHTPWVAELDSGRCTPEQFAAAMTEELELGLSASEMTRLLGEWVQGPYPGVKPLLQQLKARYRLAVLSNNNALHWEKIGRDMVWDELFDATFASHLLGLRKPEAAIYQHVQQQLAVSPSHIVFFDDNIECVEAARRVGWQAFHTKGIAELTQVLHRQGWLAPDLADTTAAVR
ncbi:MAG TPA: HAD family phosphatase [Chromobacteriaceae bacterium]|nr:HAD family phosphatase [Chromobacteriaceae bacterium]